MGVTTRTVGWLLFALVVSVPVQVNVAVAQTQQRPSASEELVTFFYKDPRPERLLGHFDELRKLPVSRNWQAYPPIVGFFAVIFRSHQDWIVRLVPDTPNALELEALASALRLAGNQSEADQLRLRFKDAGSDEKLKSELVGLPTRLEDLRIATPTHLDIVWGAAFASGDARYPGMILDFFAATANQSEEVAIDVARAVIAMAGGRKEVLQELRDKYGDDLARQIVYAAAALWALQANARQHVFVDQTVARYITQRSGTPAAKALAAFRQRK